MCVGVGVGTVYECNGADGRTFTDKPAPSQDSSGVSFVIYILRQAARLDVPQPQAVLQSGAFRARIPDYRAFAIGGAFSTLSSPTKENPVSNRRYMIQRTFPAGALEGVTPEVKKVVNANNAQLGVTWEHSYANADKTKTFCVYSGPSEAAIREAAARNQLPVDAVMEIPNLLLPS